MRRTVLLGILATVVVAALVATGLWVGLAPDDDAGSGADASTASAGTGADAGEPETEPVLLGDEPYLSPCRLLPYDDAVRLFGPLERNGYVRQEYLDRSLSPKELRKETSGLSGNVESRCEYAVGDDALTSLDVTVQQYRTPKKAEGEWVRIAYLGTGEESRKLADEKFEEGFGWVAELARENEQDMGGHPVAGAKETLLYVPGRQDFVTYVGDAVVRLSYGASDFADEPLTPREYARQAPRMRKAAALVRRNAEREDLPEGPIPTTISDEEADGDTAYLEPCDVLTADVFEEATGVAPDPDVETVSLRADPEQLRARNDDVLSRSVDNSCARTAYQAGRHGGWNADLTLRYAPAADQGTDLLDRMVGFEYSPTDDRDKISKDQLVAAGFLQTVADTEADTMYYFDSARQTGEDSRFTVAFFAVDGYAGKISIDKTASGGDLFGGKDLDLPAYREVVDAMVANIEELTGS